MLLHVRTTLAATLIIASIAFGIPLRPEKSHIYDENRLVPAQQVPFFNTLSEEFAKETGISVDAILLDDIGDRDARQYASDIAEKWMADIGQGGEILIFVAQKQRRKFVVTKGTASGILPDATIKKFEQETLLPDFRRERYGDGLLSFTARVVFAIADETGSTVNIDEQDLPKEEPMSIRGWIFIVAVFGLLIAVGSRGRRFGFFDNMKKLLSVSEIEKSPWPGIFRDTFGDNLVSAFLSGKCLMEGFDALASPWTVNFILKDNSPEEIAKLGAYEKRAARENLQFAHFYSPAEIVQTLDTTPLEYLHIANRNVPLCGIKPLAGFEPHPDKLAAQCRHEIDKALEQLHSDSKVPFAKALNDILPLLYGVYYLETKNYPENHGVVLKRYPAQDIAGLTKTLSGILATLNNPAVKPSVR
ncbi:YgcG family protein [Fibrobacter sp. UWR2]|uniref:TPM domain-containing protein n=1 Tax=Fibrobacter sp. UWR2 TaxID=1964352 RepID=UPI000B521D2A|nr:TPM domain-containing protein [Fibrobacter sp. UWR2]OWV02212.1 hypothetical protein B7994_03120 [Fibrobacter sp. UWR2]